MLPDVPYNCFEVFSLVESYSLHLASRTQRHVRPLGETRTAEVEQQVAEVVLDSETQVGESLVSKRVP